MTILHTIILAIVEGISEFLPISSTGHLVLTSAILDIAQTDFVKTFEIVIQLGAILAVIMIPLDAEIGQSLGCDCTVGKAALGDCRAYPLPGHGG